MHLSLGPIEEAADWALRIAEAAGASVYINPPGGAALYDAGRFARHGIRLCLQEDFNFVYECAGYTCLPQDVRAGRADVGQPNRYQVASRPHQSAHMRRHVEPVGIEVKSRREQFQVRRLIIMAHSYTEHSDRNLLVSDPLVSVVMPAYNHERYLGEAIEGVVRQQANFPIELIISDDCSTDSTLRIALRYQFECPRLIRVLSANRRVGMHENNARIYAAVRGKYMAFCEGDDWHRPGQAERADRIAGEGSAGRAGL